MTNYLTWDELMACASVLGAKPDDDEDTLAPLHSVDLDSFVEWTMFSPYFLKGTYTDSLHLPDSGGWWDVEFWVYPNRIYMVLAKYYHKRPAEHEGGWLAHYTGHGGRVVHVYRVGCLHPHMKRETLAMHQHRHYCLDCKFQEVVWSD